MNNSNTKGNRKLYWLLRSDMSLIDLKFKPIKAFVRSAKSMIEAEQQQLQKLFDEFDNHVTEELEDDRDAFDIYEEEIMNQQEYPRLLYNSMFLTIYSTLETEFNRICTLCKRIEGLKLGYKDLAGNNYLKQSKDYLTKVLNIDLVAANEDWKNIQIYQTLRNSIVHKQGRFISDIQHHLEFIRDMDGVHIDPDSKKIIIESEVFLNKFIDVVIRYLQTVSEAVVKQRQLSTDPNNSRQ